MPALGRTLLGGKKFDLADECGQWGADLMRRVGYEALHRFQPAGQPIHEFVDCRNERRDFGGRFDIERGEHVGRPLEQCRLDVEERTQRQPDCDDHAGECDEAHDADEHHRLEGEIARQGITSLERLADHRHDPVIGFREIAPDRGDPDRTAFELCIAHEWPGATRLGAGRQRQILIARNLDRAFRGDAVIDACGARNRQCLERRHRHLGF
jgi:hypothetical protein